MTIIDQPGKPLCVIIRHIYGCLTFEVHDLMEVEEGSELPINDSSPHKLDISFEESVLDKAFSDNLVLSDIEDLTNMNVEISFKPYSSSPITNRAIFLPKSLIK